MTLFVNTEGSYTTSRQVATTKTNCQLVFCHIKKADSWILRSAESIFTHFSEGSSVAVLHVVPSCAYQAPETLGNPAAAALLLAYLGILLPWASEAGRG